MRESELQHDRSLNLLREAIARTSVALAKSRQLLSRLSVSIGETRACNDDPGEPDRIREVRDLR